MGRWPGGIHFFIAGTDRGKKIYREEKIDLEKK